MGALSDIANQGFITSYKPSLREIATDWLARNLYSDNREGVRKAEKLVNIAEFSPFGALTAANDFGRAVGSGDYKNAALMGAMAAIPLPAPVENEIRKEAQTGIRAFHGSPHSFDRFSMDKIGTGEGAQAYGHGLYFAQDEGIARSYRDNVKDTGAIAKLNARLSELAKIMEKDSGAGYRNFKSDVGREAAGEYDALMAQRSSITNSPGHMYEVRINANPDDFLDWDKPLSEQPENVLKSLHGAGLETAIGRDRAYLQDMAEKNGPDNWYRDQLNHLDSIESISGREAYQRLTREGPHGASKLREAGIPGIKYLDAGSRPQGNALMQKRVSDLIKDNGGDLNKAKSWISEAIQNTTGGDKAFWQQALDNFDNLRGEGTRNYVVFDDKLIDIVRKYGLAGLALGLGYTQTPTLQSLAQPQPQEF